jgi:hypothetical protein
MKKLAIVGTNSETRDAAPWDDAGYDIWVFNEAPQSAWCKRWDAVFQMHRPEEYSGANMKAPAHWSWLQERRGKPVYIQAADERVPDGVVYPLEAVKALSPARWHFTSTPAYALALGIVKALQGEYSEIHVHGIDLSLSNTEYTYQLACWRYWAGYCDGAGIPLKLHSGDGVFRARLYGYEGAKFIDAAYFKEHAGKLASEWRAAEKHINNLKKGIERIIEARDFDKFPPALMEFQKACQDGGILAGKLREAERYQTVYDRQEFERSAAQSQKDGPMEYAKMDMMRGVIEYLFPGWKGTNNPQFANQIREFVTQLAKHAYDGGAQKGIFQVNMEYRAYFDRLMEAG